MILWKSDVLHDHFIGTNGGLTIGLTIEMVDFMGITKVFSGIHHQH
jgi:hypothetical protein